MRRNHNNLSRLPGKKEAKKVTVVPKLNFDCLLHLFNYLPYPVQRRFQRVNRLWQEASLSIRDGDDTLRLSEFVQPCASGGRRLLVTIFLQILTEAEGRIKALDLRVNLRVRNSPDFLRVLQGIEQCSEEVRSGVVHVDVAIPSPRRMARAGSTPPTDPAPAGLDSLLRLDPVGRTCRRLPNLTSVRLVECESIHLLNVMLLSCWIQGITRLELDWYSPHTEPQGRNPEIWCSNDLTRKLWGSVILYLPDTLVTLVLRVSIPYKSHEVINDHEVNFIESLAFRLCVHRPLPALRRLVMYLQSDREPVEWSIGWTMDCLRTIQRHLGPQLTRHSFYKTPYPRIVAKPKCKKSPTQLQRLFCGEQDPFRLCERMQLTQHLTFLALDVLLLLRLARAEVKICATWWPADPVPGVALEAPEEAP